MCLAPLDVNDAAAYPFSNAFNYTATPLAPAHMVQTRVREYVNGSGAFVALADRYS